MTWQPYSDVPDVSENEREFEKFYIKTSGGKYVLGLRTIDESFFELNF